MTTDKAATPRTDALVATDRPFAGSTYAEVAFDKMSHLSRTLERALTERTELAVAMALREVKALLMKLHDTYDRPTSYIERQVLLTWIAKVTYLTSAATLAKLVELERDAGLYRKLRKSHWSDSPDALCVTTSKAVKLGYDTYSGELLDAAIDNAKEGK